MMVKTKGDKNLINTSSLSEGKGIIRNVLAVLKEAEIFIKEALDSGDQRSLKTLPTKIKLIFKSVKKIDETLDTVIVCDGNHFLSTRLLSTATAKKTTEKNKFCNCLRALSPSQEIC